MSIHDPQSAEVPRGRAQDFLELVQRSKRGRLKLYLGFAAGVGKTYRMLEEAHALQKRGVDIVVGFVETHGRTDTEALVAGLDVVPRSLIEYRGLVVGEMDLDAILRRRPEVTIVDELPHTNAPGSRHEKRYQDVLEILAAGINVIGALNIQHLESLKDIVERTTGVHIRETIPDTFLKQADQIVNLDLAVEDLTDRLSRGKIYAPDKITTALANFFTEQNLATLRELALREVAESVDRTAISQARSAQQRSRADSRVMVCLASGSPRSAALLRRGSRLAGRLNTDWFAVYVETPSEAPNLIDAETQRHLHANIQKAKELGAEVIRLQAKDPVAGLLDFARSHAVGSIVIGRSAHPWWQRLLRGSVMHRMVDQSDGFDVHIVSLDEGGKMTLRGKLLLAQAPLAIALIAVGGLAVSGIAALGQRSQLILKDNYRSVLAAQRMKEAIERIDSGTMFLVLGETEQGSHQIRGNQALFENELKVQEGNVTEAGEQEATARLRRLWQTYQAKLERQSEISDFQAAKRFYLDDMQKEFEAVKDAADRILALNQDAMLSKSDEAERLARWANGALLSSTAAALAIGMLLSVGLTNRLLRPLSVLTQAVQRVGKGDFEARAKVSGQDEISQLAEQFNAMTEHLGEYRNSSLGELLLAQRASQAAIDSIPDPVIVFAGDGGVLILNDAAETLLANGHSEPGELLAGATPALRTALDTARSHVLQGKGPYLPKGFEDSFAVTTPGGDRWFLLRATPVYEDQGHIAGATVILQDVTKLRRFDELKNDLVATVAHEFRTPLTSLRMAIHLCLEGLAGPLSEKQTDLLSTAREDCSRLQRTVDELLDLARIQSGKIMLSLRAVPASDLVKSALDVYRARATQQQVDVTADTNSDGAPVLADPDRIGLVFSNLLANALRHTPPGGSVRVKVLPQSGRTRFEVTDSGEGIPPEYQAAVFEKFFRVPGTTSGAAGLGLSLSKEIVEAHHGKIGVNSKPGSGSTFWFTLPAAGGHGQS